MVSDSMYRYLIVEDSKIIREETAAYIVEKSDGNIIVDEASDGYTALDLVNNNKYDLVILDIMLPGISGFDLCRTIRRDNICPIIFLTALIGDDNLLMGYSLGADDYITKPFSLVELYAKSEALVKRYKGNIIPQKLKVDDITLDPATMQVFVGQREAEITAKEYSILKLLMENENVVFSRDALISRLWDMSFDGVNRVVDTQIKNLRKKLGASGKNIVTVIGGGYKISSRK